MALTAICMIAVGAAVYAWASRGAPTAGIVPAVDAPGSGIIAAAPAAASSSGATAGKRHDSNAEPHDSRPVSADPLPVYEAAADPQPSPETAPASDEDPGNERAESIRQAGAGRGSPEDLALLAGALRSDAITRNRLLAVNAVRALGADPALRAWALNELRAAQAADRNALVASHATDAIAALSKP